MVSTTGTICHLAISSYLQPELCLKAREQLFTERERVIGGLPSTQAALIQHIKKAGHCWAQMMIAAAELPSWSEWGWNKKAEGGW